MYNQQKEFDALDIIAIVSFIIGFQSYELARKNLKENEQQTNDLKDILDKLSTHLDKQDNQLDNQAVQYEKIISLLERR